MRNNDTKTQTDAQKLNFKLGAEQMEWTKCERNDTKQKREKNTVKNNNERQSKYTLKKRREKQKKIAIDTSSRTKTKPIWSFVCSFNVYAPYVLC